MPGPKTNEREGTRAVLRYAGMSAFKARQVVDAVRGKPVHEAADLLRFLERDAAVVVEKLLQSAVANASNNDGLDPEELYVSACYVDEGPTAKRWRPRARGRATRIRKRSCHITLIVSRLPEHRLARLQARRRAENLAMRARRVEATRRARAEGAEGTSRRQRRHPEAFPAPEEEAAEAAAEGTGPEAGAAEAAGAEAAGDEAAGAEDAGAAAGGDEESQAATGAAEAPEAPAPAEAPAESQKEEDI
jgi:large subunit ribosomal protein L22